MYGVSGFSLYSLLQGRNSMEEGLGKETLCNPWQWGGREGSGPRDKGAFFQVTSPAFHLFSEISHKTPSPRSSVYEHKRLLRNIVDLSHVTMLCFMKPTCCTRQMLSFTLISWSLEIIWEEVKPWPLWRSPKKEFWLEYGVLSSVSRKSTPSPLGA